MTNPITYDDKPLPSVYTKHHTFPLEMQMLELFLRKEDRIIDIGCGSGRILVPLQAAGYNVRGIEYSQAMCDAAIAAGGVNVEQGDARDLWFAPNRVDCAVFSFSMQQILPNLDFQKDYLRSMLETVPRILFITTLSDYFDIAPTTKHSAVVRSIEEKRFFSREQLMASGLPILRSMDIVYWDQNSNAQFRQGLRDSHVSAYQLAPEELPRAIAGCDVDPYLPLPRSYYLLGRE